MRIVLDAVTKKVSGETHIDNITLELESGTTNVVLGHTLAGKTSLLRLMAGLDHPTSGRIIMDGKDLKGIPVRKRNVAMVYQQFVNYPSMTVYKNIASPLLMSGINRSEIERRVRTVAEMLHIENLLDRLPSELSGGQQQRTAIARALVKDAELLLLDEPLVNLDYKLREELRAELQDILKQRKAVVVYTTTEPTEALVLGGQIAVIDRGRLLQTGPTSQVYHNPSTKRVAQIFCDPPFNFINGTVYENQLRIGQKTAFPLPDHLKSLSPGEYQLGIRPNHFGLSRQSENEIEIRARIALAEINGAETFIHLNYEDDKLVVQKEGVDKLRIDSELSIYIDPGRFYVYSQTGELIISPFREDGRDISGAVPVLFG
jgi:glycerol transport system ATP-binding protein